MPRLRPSFSLATAVFALAAAAASAQNAAAPAAAKPDDTTLVPVFTPAAAAPAIPTATVQEDDHGDRRRIQSSELNDAVISSIPKYAPPKPVAPKSDAEVEAHDPDKPRNGIIRLPKYVVHDSTPPIFTKKDVLTPTGRDDLAMRQYIMDTNGMPTFAAYMAKQLFQANASQQYADAERASNISSLHSAANAAAAGGDAAEAKFIRDQTDDTYLRRSDWAPIGSHTTTSSSPGDAGGGNGQ